MEACASRRRAVNVPMPEGSRDQPYGIDRDLDPNFIAIL